MIDGDDDVELSTYSPTLNIQPTPSAQQQSTI